MIKAHAYGHGFLSLKIKGNIPEIMTDLALISARVITQLNIPDELIKNHFESVLMGVKYIREGKK